MNEIYRGPRFRRLAHSGIEGDLAFFDFDAEDGKRYRIDLDKDCVPPTLAALIAEAGRLIEAGHDIAKNLQPVRTREVGTLTDDFGNVSLVMTLESGARIPINLQSGDLEKLSRQFAELAQRAKGQAPIQ